MLLESVSILKIVEVATLNITASCFAVRPCSSRISLSVFTFFPPFKNIIVRLYLSVNHFFNQFDLFFNKIEQLSSLINQKVRLYFTLGGRKNMSISNDQHIRQVQRAEEYHRRHLIASNLRNLLDANHVKQVDLANAVGVTATTINDYLKERGTPSFGVIQSMADFFGVKKSDIDSIYKEKNSTFLDSEIKEFNYIDTTVSAGVPAAVDPFTADKLEKIPISKSILGKYANDNLLFIRVNGDSMDKVFPDKSLIGILKVDYFSDFNDGDIVVFSDNGDFCVKRIYINTKLQLVIFTPDSNNKDFLPITYQLQNMDGVQIIGKVVTYTVTI